MKILHLTDLYFPSVGGMQRTVEYIAEEQIRQGHEIVVVTLTTTGRASFEVSPAGVRVHRIKAGFTKIRWAWSALSTPHHPPFPDPVVALRLRRIIKLEAPDAIIAHNWMIYSFLIAKSKKSPPVMWTPHDYSVTCPKKSKYFYRDDGVCPGPNLGRCIACSNEQYGHFKGAAISVGLRLSRVLHRRVDRFVANSDAVGEFMRFAVPTGTRVDIVTSSIPRGVEHEAEEIDRPSYLPSEDGFILFVGHLGTHKGISDLLEAYEGLTQPAPPLVVLGIPDKRQPQQWPPGTIVKTLAPHAEVMAAWKHCAFGVIPSQWAEPFATVAIEAGAMGKSTVVTNVGGLPQIVADGVTGLVVPPRDPESLRTAIQTLIDEPARARDMGLAARERTKDLRLDVMSDKLIEALPIGPQVKMPTPRVPVAPKEWRPLKILHITDLFSPCIGGMEMHILNLVRERHRRGHDVSVVTLTLVGEAGTQVEDTGYTVHRIKAGFTAMKAFWNDPNRLFHPPFPDPIVARELRQIIEREKPDIIHAHNWMAFSYLAFKGDQHPPMLWMLHDYSLTCPKKTAQYYQGDGQCAGSSIVRCIKCSPSQYGAVKGTGIAVGLHISNRTYVRRVEKLLANSSATADFSRQLAGRDREIEIVPGFVVGDLDEESISVERPSYLPPQDDYLLFVGAISAHKGIYDLLDAYQRLHKPVPPLVVLGTAQGDSPTQWPEGVTVRHQVPHPEVMAAIRHCRFVIVPSRWHEPFGLVALEAATLGKAIVATRVGGLSDLVEGCGILVERASVPELTSAIQLLIDEPELAEQLGSQGRVKAKDYTVSKTADRLDQMMFDLVDERAGHDSVLSPQASNLA